MHAVGNGNVEAAKLLIERGAHSYYQRDWTLGIEWLNDPVRGALELLKERVGEKSDVYQNMKSVIIEARVKKIMKH